MQSNYPRGFPWRDIQAESPENAANDFHSYYFASLRQLQYDQGSPHVCFVLVEVEGHGELISRMYYSGIYRRGGIRNQTTISDIAKKLGYEGKPEELLESGWDCEEDDWK
jgi:hypothetical protein